MTRAKDRKPPDEVRCAIYTRKSTEENLDLEFNSLDAQRESGEAYIATMKHEGWVLAPDRYDDGGFTGGNADRPALRRLLADIEVGKIQIVIVYKVDRLSRSLLDFAQLMQVFEKHGVAFVSVTQRFDTSNSMGRLTLNMLMSFAQFEREMISERTRDKIAATRRKGQWTGGPPILGYDVVAKKLLVNADEAEQVRQIFGLYLELGSLLPVVQELTRRGWTTKQYATKAGTVRGGLPITKTRLHYILTNVVYSGRIGYKTEVCEGEHEAIVDRETFDRVQEMLHENGQSGCAEKRNKHGALLRGILRCAACDCGMTHSFTSKGNVRYRYYRCNISQQRGAKVCPAPSVPAEAIEKFVVDEIRVIGRDPTLLAAVVAQSRRLADEAIQGLKRERATLDRQRRADEAELRRLGGSDATNGDLAWLAEIQERASRGERRLVEIEAVLATLAGNEINEAEVAAALSRLDVVWAALKPVERAKVISLLVESVEYDGSAGEVEINFYPAGVKSLADQAIEQETAA